MRTLRVTTLCAVILCVAVSVSTARADAGPPGDGSDSEVIRVGYSGKLFTNVNRKDVHVAVELWAKQMTTNWVRPAYPTIVFFDDTPGLVRAVHAGEVDMVSTNALEYVEIRDRVPLEPWVVSVHEEGTIYDEYVILVRRSNSSQEMEGLRGSNLLVEAERQANPIPLMWLDTLLMARGLGRHTEFFGLIRKVEKSAQAVFTVFFDKADACIVTRKRFETLVELNPQLGEELLVRWVSPEYLPTVTCFTGAADPDKRRLIADGAFDMPNHARGRQILALFGMTDLKPWDPAYLQSIIDLAAEHDELTVSLDERVR